MDWTARIDGYCERLGPEFRAEPWNALTSLAFLLAAAVMWRRTRGMGDLRWLVAILGSIGVGSFLFHTVATAWAALADVLPILLFILVYLYLVNRRVMGWPARAAALGTAAFLPYAAAVTWVLSHVPGLAVSSLYWTVPILLLAYAPAVPHRATARGFVAGAALLSLSIALRSLDAALCDEIPIGTHIWWHLLNALMLGWMIEVLRRHRLEAAGAGG